MNWWNSTHKFSKPEVTVGASTFCRVVIVMYSWWGVTFTGSLYNRQAAPTPLATQTLITQHYGKFGQLQVCSELHTVILFVSCRPSPIVL